MFGFLIHTLAPVDKTRYKMPQFSPFDYTFNMKPKLNLQLTIVLEDQLILNIIIYFQCAMALVFALRIVWDLYTVQMVWYRVAVGATVKLWASRFTRKDSVYCPLTAVLATRTVK